MYHKEPKKQLFQNAPKAEAEAKMEISATTRMMSCLYCIGSALVLYSDVLTLVTVEKSGRWGGTQPCLAQPHSLTHSHIRSRSITSKPNSLSFIFRGEFAFYPRGRMSRRELREIYTRCSRHNIKRFFVRTNFSSTPFFVGKRKKRVSEHRSFLFCTVRSPISQPSAIDVKNGPAFLCFGKVQLKLDPAVVLLNLCWPSASQGLSSFTSLNNTFNMMRVLALLSLLVAGAAAFGKSLERETRRRLDQHFTLE